MLRNLSFWPNRFNNKIIFIQVLLNKSTIFFIFVMFDYITVCYLDRFRYENHDMKMKSLFSSEIENVRMYLYLSEI